MLTTNGIRRDSENSWLKRKKELIECYSSTIKDYSRDINAKKTLTMMIIQKFLHLKNKPRISKIILYGSYVSVMIFVGYLMTLVN